MPIVAINPDGTVKIARKSGRDAIDVKPEELVRYNPSLVKDYNEMIEAQAIQKKNAQIISSGGDITQADKAGTQYEFNRDQALKSALEAEALYAPGTDQSLALSKDATRQSKAAAGGSALIKSFSDPNYQERLNSYKAQVNLLLGGLTQLSGSGAPQADEAKRLLATAPNETSTDTEAKIWFDAVKRLGGMEDTQTTPAASTAERVEPNATQQSQIQSKQERQTLIPESQDYGAVGNFLLKGILKPAVDNITNFSRDIIQTAPAAARNQANQQLLAQAEQLARQALQEQDPQRRSQMLQQSQDLAQQISADSRDITEGFSQDVQQNAVKRGIDYGSSVATLADLGLGLGKFVSNPQAAVQSVTDMAKSGKDVIQNILKGNGGEVSKDILNVGKNLADEGKAIRETAIRQATESGAMVDGSSIANAITKWGDDAIAAGEDAAKVEKQVLQAIQKYDGKQFTPQQAKDIWDTAIKGFKDNGKAGNTLLADYQRALRDTLRIQLEDVAPGFEKGTQMIAEGLSRDKVLSSVATSLEKSDLKKLLTPAPNLLRKILDFSGKSLGTAAGGYLAGNAIGKVLSRD